MHEEAAESAACAGSARALQFGAYDLADLISKINCGIFLQILQILMRIQVKHMT